jgi:hypothetical protein
VARDRCGKADTSTTIVTVNFVNRPPIANCHGDTTITVCNLTSQVCLQGFTASDPDGNLATKTVTGGTLIGNTVCFTPVSGLNNIRMIAADSCGLSDTCLTHVTVIVNSAPMVSCPNNSVIFVDSLRQICLPGFTVSDINGNLASRTVIGGTLHGDTVCFTPVRGINTLVFIAVDACGLADTCTTMINVALSHVGSCPTITRPFGDTTICTYGSFCDTIDVVDSDNDHIHASVSFGHLDTLLSVPGHWRGLYCFTPPDSACGNDYSYRSIFRAWDDSCGACDSSIIDISVMGIITVRMPDKHFWPGDVDSIPVTISALNNCFCMGGFEIGRASCRERVSLHV